MYEAVLSLGAITELKASFPIHCSFLMSAEKRSENSEDLREQELEDNIVSRH